MIEKQVASCRPQYSGNASIGIAHSFELVNIAVDCRLYPPHLGACVQKNKRPTHPWKPDGEEWSTRGNYYGRVVFAWRVRGHWQRHASNCGHKRWLPDVAAVAVVVVARKRQVKYWFVRHAGPLVRQSLA